MDAAAGAAAWTAAQRRETTSHLADAADDNLVEQADIANNAAAIDLPEQAQPIGRMVRIGIDGEIGDDVAEALERAVEGGLDRRAGIDAQLQSTTATYGRLDAALHRAAGAGFDGRCRPGDEARPTLRSRSGHSAQGASGSRRADRAGPRRRLWKPSTLAQVPVGAWLPAAVKLQVGANVPLALDYKRCLPGACLADLEVSPALDTQMKSAVAGGTLVFQMVAGKDITLPLSFRSLKAASDALDRPAIKIPHRSPPSAEFQGSDPSRLRSGSSPRNRSDVALGGR